MKKIAGIILTLLLAFSLGISAYADLGAPEFEDWYVVCGPKGYDYKDYKYMDYGDPGDPPIHRVEPGAELMVFSYNDDDSTYFLLGQQQGDAIEGTGFVTLSESDFNKYFFDNNKTIDKGNGKKLDKEVKGKVTSDTGIVLRQGPATTYKSYVVIPHNTKITYQYTYRYGGYNWGYTSYKGKSGWACIDYVKEITEKTTKKTTTTQSTTEQTTEEPTTEPATTETYEKEVEEPGFFSNTRNVILVCCIGTSVLALTAVVILLIIQKTKKS